MPPPQAVVTTEGPKPEPRPGLVHWAQTVAMLQDCKPSSYPVPTFFRNSSPEESSTFVLARNSVFLHSHTAEEEKILFPRRARRSGCSVQETIAGRSLAGGQWGRSPNHCCHLLAVCRQSLENAVHNAPVTMMQNASIINK